MKRTVLVVFASIALLTACDEDKKKEEILAKTASKDAGTVAIPIAPSASVAQAVEPPKEKTPCPTGPELVLKDKDLEAELRLKLAKPNGPLTVSELTNVRSLNLTKKQSLDELDECVVPKLSGLKHLYLGPGKLRDLEPIANLTSLESLRASINEVATLKPLEKLVRLDRVDLGRTHVRDIAPLGHLVNLTELQLDDTQVSDLAPLAKTTKLEKLSLKHTNVTDVSPLKGLTKLRFLYIEGCAVGNLDTLQPLVARGLRIVTK